MADLEEVFKILKDSATGAGEAPVARDEGEAAAGQAGLIGFSFKDASGNVVLPSLTAGGAIPVDTSGASGTCFYAQGSNAGSLSEVTLATITGSLSKQYSQIEAVGSCLRTTRFNVYYVDDAGGTPVDTLIYSFLVGAGAYTVPVMLKCAVINTAGGTGTQNFEIRAQNLFNASTMEAALALLESA